MKKVCLVAVCYNAFQETIEYLSSVEAAYSESVDLELTVVLSDNSSQNAPNALKSRDRAFNYHYIKNDNVGYFPGFSAGLAGVNKSEFDYIIISNVDLKLSTNFFVNLTALTLSDDVAVVAPSIISMKDGRDLNPKIITRPSRKKLKFLMHLFSLPFMFIFYISLARCKEFFRARRRKTITQYESDTNIYAPHGSFIVFTKKYSEIKNSFDYPRFLFGEEVHVAEVVRDNELKVEYNKSLTIYDIEHGSTSLAGSKFLAKHHVLSYKFLINKYFMVK